jgi:hypothetical protein
VRETGPSTIPVRPPGQTGRIAGPRQRRPVAVRFGTEVVLTKEEVFGACQALADAGRVLVRSGGVAEADTLGNLFALLEERLTSR